MLIGLISVLPLLNKNEEVVEMKEVEKNDQHLIDSSLHIKKATQQEWDAIKLDKTPGLKWAREQGLTREYEEEWLYENGEGTLRIEEIWYTPHQIHVFYSVDITEEIEEEFDLPTWTATLSLPGDEEVPNWGGYDDNWTVEDNRMVDGRYHSRVTYAPLLAKNGEVVEEIEEMSFTNMIVFNRTKRHIIEDQTIAVSYNSNEVNIIDVEINEVFSTEEVDVHLHSFMVSPVHMMLNLDVENKKIDRMEHLGFTLSTDKGEQRYGYFFRGMDDESTLIFAPFTQLPNEIEIELHTAGFMSEEKVEFTIPIEKDDLMVHLQMEKQFELNEEIGSVLGIEMGLRSVSYREGSLFWEVQLEHEGSAIHLLPSSLRTRAMLNDNDQEKLANYLSYSINDYEPLGDEFYGSTGIGPDFVTAEVMNISSIEADDLQVKIDNIGYEQMIEQKKVIKIE